MLADRALAAAAHANFELCAMTLGAWLHRRALRARGRGSPLDRANFAVLAGLLLGAALGNKLVFLVERPDVWARLLAGEWLVPGQSLVGGLLGGLLGVELAKALTGQRESTGDALVVPLVVGIAVGRVGCLLAGLFDDTYGLPTSLPWGIDLGDGVPRHPAPLYEIAFVLALGALLRHRRAQLSRVPGVAFKLFLAGYLLFRLLGDALKPVRAPYALSLSGIQLVCLIALALYLPWVALAARKLFHPPEAVDVPQEPTLPLLRHDPERLHALSATGRGEDPAQG